MFLQESLALIKNSAKKTRLLLMLDGLSLTDTNACELAQALSSNSLPKECSFYLGANNINDLGAIALFNILKKMPKDNYCYLSLDNNQISNKTIVELANEFKSGTLPDNLYICLGWNKLTSAGLRIIIEALQSPNAPQKLTLSLSGNNFNISSIEYLSMALKEKKLPPRLMIYGINQEIISLCETTKKEFFLNLTMPSPRENPSLKKTYSIHTFHGSSRSTLRNAARKIIRNNYQQKQPLLS